MSSQAKFLIGCIISSLLIMQYGCTGDKTQQLTSSHENETQIRTVGCFSFRVPKSAVVNDIESVDSVSISWQEKASVLRILITRLGSNIPPSRDAYEHLHASYIDTYLQEYGEIPKSSLIAEENGFVVYAVQPQEFVKKREVTTYLIMSTEWVEVICPHPGRSQPHKSQLRIIEGVKLIL